MNEQTIPKKEEYLNEEKFQKSKHKLVMIAAIILVVGIILGGGLIATGIMRYNTEKANIAKNEEKLEKQIADKRYECDSLDMQDPNWFAENTKCQSEVSSLNSKLGNLDTNLWNNIYYYIGGGFILILSLMISGSIYFIAKRREIMAFGIQQTMPVAQEGIEKMAPTIGNAAGTIGQGLAKGITQGIAEGKNASNQNTLNNVNNSEDNLNK